MEDNDKDKHTSKPTSPGNTSGKATGINADDGSLDDIIAEGIDHLNKDQSFAGTRLSKRKTRFTPIPLRMTHPLIFFATCLVTVIAIAYQLRPLPPARVVNKEFARKTFLHLVDSRLKKYQNKLKLADSMDVNSTPISNEEKEVILDTILSSSKDFVSILFKVEANEDPTKSQKLISKSFAELIGVFNNSLSKKLIPFDSWEIASSVNANQNEDYTNQNISNNLGLQVITSALSHEGDERAP